MKREPDWPTITRMAGQGLHEEAVEDSDELMRLDLGAGCAGAGLRSKKGGLDRFDEGLSK